MKSLSTFKLLAITILLSIFLCSCNGTVFTTLGEATVQTVEEGGEKLFIIDTSSDGIIYKKSRKELVKVLPLTSVKLSADNSYELERGTVVHLYELYKNSGSVNINRFVRPEWGGCSFVRLMVSDEHGALEGRAALKYIMVDGSDYTVNTKVHSLFSYGGFNYYGFFVPYNVYWKLRGTEFMIELFRETESGEERVGEVRMVDSVRSREFVTQKVFFKQSKSREVKNTSRSSYQEEHSQRRKIWAVNDTSAYLENGFDFPLKQIDRISSEFGLTREWVLSSGKVYSRNIHLGVDYPHLRGTPVYAAAAGTVRYAHNGAYVGNTVIIEHGLGVYTDYSHMDTITVKPGQPVKKGEQIGTVGTTGASTGNHLHWGMRVYGLPVDPRSMLTADDIFIP